ncbi:hypothetical protein BaRGS_00004582, partial [Batillaria attramentaria]
EEEEFLSKNKHIGDVGPTRVLKAEDIVNGRSWGLLVDEMTFTGTRNGPPPTATLEGQWTRPARYQLTIVPKELSSNPEIKDLSMAIQRLPKGER